MINIGGDVGDSSYRYKMPALKTKVEGRGNGIKTVIVNMTDIAKALHCNPAYPTKFFGVELGAQSKYSAKTERAIVNGSHDQSDLAKMLEKYIELFILCPRCRLPEINMVVKKQNIKIDCAACGYNGAINTAHRLGTYILKHPPNEKAFKKKKDGAKDKKAERRAKKAQKGVEDNGEEAKVEAAEESTVTTNVMTKTSIEDEEWYTDTSKEAQKARKEAEFAELQSVEAANVNQVDKILTIAKNENKVESPVTVLQVFMAQKERTSQEIIAELRRLQLSRDMDDSKRVKVLLEAVIDTSEPKKITKEFMKNASLLKNFTKDRQSSTLFIQCVEELVGLIEPKLLGKTPMIFQTLYEADVLEEEYILAWADSPPEASWLVNKDVAASVREKAAPFISWLREAESGSEDDEE